jgi:ribosome recycling factor
LHRSNFPGWEDDMIDDVQRETRERMDGAIKSLTHDLTSIRTGRANPAILEHVQVEYFGTPTAINQLAVITVPEPRLIAIRPFSAGDIGAISKALMKSDLGLTPTNDGKLIRLAIPPLTEERRRDLSKQVSRRVEEARVAVRNIRRDAINDLRDFEKESLITEDDLEDGTEKVQKLTDDAVKRIDGIGDVKTSEIMEI